MGKNFEGDGRSEFFAWVAQLVERVLGKDEVTGSIPVPGSIPQTEAGGGNSAVESRPSKPMVAGSNPVPRSILPGGIGELRIYSDIINDTRQG